MVLMVTTMVVSKTIATMKNLFTRLMLVAVAAIGIVACQDGFEDVTIAPEASEVVMTITADADDTRTVLDEANKMVQWSDGDALKVIENSKNYRTTTNTVITDGKAQFTVAFGEDTTSESFTYNAFYPATAVSEDDADKVNNAKVKVIVKDAQNPTATSFDPAADILVSKQIVTDAQPTELSMQFARLVALGKMTLTNLPTSSTISKVAFSVEGTDENNATKIAGRNYVDATIGVVSEYGYYGKTNTITLNYKELISTRDIYFTCNPFVLVEGDKFTVKVTCNDYVYTREVTIPEGRSLTFEQGNLNTFSVNMEDATKEENFVFTNGEYALIANSGDKYYALSSAANGSRLNAVEVTYTPGESLTAQDATLKWTIANTNSGYTFKGSNSQYIAWPGSNNAKTQSEIYYLDIAKDGDTGRYWVTSKVDAGRKLVKNSTYDYFAFYTSDQSGSLYVVPITIDTTPILSVDATNVTFDAIGGTKTVGINTNVTDEITIASTNSQFSAVVNEAKTELVITALANDSTDVLTGTITLTCGGLTATVSVIQSGKITITGGRDDFNTVDKSTTYKTYTTIAGWEGCNCSVVGGGNTDANPTFNSLLGADEDTRAFVINGKTSTVGTITSPILSGGCGNLSLNYGLPYTDTKIKFRIDILQNDVEVFSTIIENPDTTKFEKYTWSEDVNVSGDFQIVITNLCPSESTSNKDRVAIWDIIWTN